MEHIFLYGPPASGKTTLGKLLAHSLELPFVDLDEAIESRVGMPIHQLMEQRGEEDFREMESSILREQLSGRDSVIALGGGTLLQDGNRAVVEANGQIVCLRAEPSQLLQRLQADLHVRPLLAGDLENKLAALLAARSGHYDSFGERLDVDQPPDELTRKLQAALGRFHLAAMGGYDLIVEPGGMERLGEVLCERGVTRCLLVTDPKVAELYSARVLQSLRRSGYECSMLTIPGGESCKTLETVSRLWQGFLEAGLDRKSTVIALGGGVVGDLAGFAASTFMRGIDWVCVPTTLLSMVDASIGGKTAFDLPEGKNLIGSFHAPLLVLTDPDGLSTLPDVEFRAGLAEVVKHGVIADPQLFELCAAGLSRVQEDLRQILRRAVSVKVGIIESDPYEKGERAALNFGHTVGHAVELISRFSIRHGEAVAIGMVAETRLAERLHVARRGLSEGISDVLSCLGLPVRIPENLPRRELVAAMQADKKKAGGVARFTLPVDIGCVQVNVAVNELDSVLEDG